MEDFNNLLNKILEDNVLPNGFQSTENLQKNKEMEFEDIPLTNKDEEFYNPKTSLDQESEMKTEYLLSKKLLSLVPSDISSSLNKNLEKLQLHVSKENELQSNEILVEAIEQLMNYASKKFVNTVELSGIIKEEGINEKTLVKQLHMNCIKKYEEYTNACNGFQKIIETLAYQKEMIDSVTPCNGLSNNETKMKKTSEIIDENINPWVENIINYSLVPRDALVAMQSENKNFRKRLQEYYDVYGELNDDSAHEGSNMQKKLRNRIVRLEEDVYKLQMQEDKTRIKCSLDKEIKNAKFDFKDCKIEDSITKYNPLNKIELSEIIRLARKENVNFWKLCYEENQTSLMRLIKQRYYDFYELEQIRLNLNELQDLCNTLQNVHLDLLLKMKKKKEFCKKSTYDPEFDIIIVEESKNVDDENSTQVYDHLLRLCTIIDLMINKISNILINRNQRSK